MPVDVCYEYPAADFLNPLLEHVGGAFGIRLLLVCETMLLGTFGIGLVLDEALVVEVCERGIENHKCGGLEALFVAVALADVL